MRLSDTPGGCGSRMDAAREARSWRSYCAVSGTERWLSWNFRNEDLPKKLSAKIVDAVSHCNKSSSGPNLLIELQNYLAKIWPLSSAEESHVPSVLYHHCKSLKYYLPLNDWGDGSLPGESRSTLRPGDKRKYLFTSDYTPWITFETSKHHITDNADRTIESLGLNWSNGIDVYRIRIRKESIQGVKFIRPTIFNTSMCGKKNLPTPDWRARPREARDPQEPWGLTRNMTTGEAGMPELIVHTIKKGAIFEFQYVGRLQIDWSKRPYLMQKP